MVDIWNNSKFSSLGSNMKATNYKQLFGNNPKLTNINSLFGNTNILHKQPSIIPTHKSNKSNVNSVKPTNMAKSNINMPSNLYLIVNGKRESLYLNKQLGKGGEGTVYTCNNLGGKYVAKIYHKIDDIIEDKIEFMINNKPNPIEASTFIICWPEYKIVDNNNNFKGYVMRKGFDDSVEIYELTKPKIKNQNFAKFGSNYPNGNLNKLKLLINICCPLHHITNSDKYVMVDFKPQNILTDVKGRISVLDTDSFQISDKGQILFRAKVATPEYTPKEYANVVPSKIKYNQATDMFAIGVSFYQILMGIHPYVVKPMDQRLTTIADYIYSDLFAYGNNVGKIKDIPPPHKRFVSLPNEIKELFVKTFTTIHRPKVSEWGETITQCINNYVNKNANIANAKANNIAKQISNKPTVNNHKCNNHSQDNIDKALEKLYMLNNNPSDVEIGVIREIINTIKMLGDCAYKAQLHGTTTNNKNSFTRKSMALRCALNLAYTYFMAQTANCMDTEALKQTLDYLKPVGNVFHADGSTKLDSAALNELYNNPFYKLEGSELIEKLVAKTDEDVIYIKNNSKLYDVFMRNYVNFKLLSNTDTYKDILPLYKSDDVNIGDFTNTLVSMINARYSAKYNRIDILDKTYR